MSWRQCFSNTFDGRALSICLETAALTPARCMAETLLTYEEIAERLGVPRRAVETLVQARAIPVIKLTRRTHRFRWSEVEAALAKLTVKPR